MTDVRLTHTVVLAPAGYDGVTSVEALEEFVNTALAEFNNPVVMVKNGYLEAREEV